MTQESVISIIKSVCANKAEISIVGSNSTESVYCIVKVGSATTKFRISDHVASRKGRHIRTLVWGKSTKKEHIERFIENTIHTLKTKSALMAMERIKENVKES